MKITSRNDGSAPAPVGSRLAAVLAGASARALRDVEVERIGLRAKVRLLTRAEEEEVTIRVASWLTQLATSGVTETAMNAVALMPVSSRICVETLAIAVRDPDDPSRPFGSFEEWSQLDDLALSHVHGVYRDLVEEMNPAGVELSEEENAAIVDALKKKERSSLIAFGAPKLAAFLTTTADPPASSASPKSSPGQSSPA